MTNIAEAFRGLSSSITAASDITNSEFPFVTVPAFEVYGGQARLKSGIEAFSYNPLLWSSDQIAPWLNYSLNNQWWIEESRNYLSGSDGLVVSDYSDTPINPIMWEVDLSSDTFDIHPVDSDPPYAPIWQVSPPPFSNLFLNYNMHNEDFVKIMLPVILGLKGM